MTLFQLTGIHLNWDRQIGYYHKKINVPILLTFEDPSVSMAFWEKMFSTFD